MPAVEGAQRDANAFVCSYRVGRLSGRPAELGFELGEAGAGVRVPLAPDVMRGSRDSTRLWPKEGCSGWSRRASVNVVVSIDEVGGAQHCRGVEVDARVLMARDTWVFPELKVRGGLAGAQGVQLDLDEVSGTPFPPTSLKLQLVEADGGIWVLDLKREGSGRRYVGLLSTARPAPWKLPKAVRLDAAAIDSLLLGWGEYQGASGERFAFVIRSVSLLR